MIDPITYGIVKKLISENSGPSKMPTATVSDDTPAVTFYDEDVAVIDSGHPFAVASDDNYFIGICDGGYVVLFDESNGLSAVCRVRFNGYPDDEDYGYFYDPNDAQETPIRPESLTFGGGGTIPSAMQEVSLGFPEPGFNPNYVQYGNTASYGAIIRSGLPFQLNSLNDDSFICICSIRSYNTKGNLVLTDISTGGTAVCGISMSGYPNASDYGYLYDLSDDTTPIRPEDLTWN